MLYWYLFFFVTVGAKLLLAGLMIYFLLPEDRRCSRCDEETLLLRPSPAGRVGRWISLGRIQRRWCPRCHWEGMARRGPKASGRADVPSGTGAPTRR